MTSYSSSSEYIKIRLVRKTSNRLNNVNSSNVFPRKEGTSNDHYNIYMFSRTINEDVFDIQPKSLKVGLVLFVFPCLELYKSTSLVCSTSCHSVQTLLRSKVIESKVDLLPNLARPQVTFLHGYFDQQHNNQAN